MGKKNHITEEDVELVYGFPRGDITYCREKWKSNAPFMRELAEQCDTKPGNVNHKAVEQLMLADHEGGPQFKRLFLVLLESALIEPSTCGMIKSKIGEIIDDLDNVRNINWCSYTIFVLKFAMGNWSKTEKNAFAEPLLFLMIPDDCAVGSSQNLFPKDFIHEEQQQGNVEKNLDVNESGVGSSSQNILPSHMVANLVKYIKQINDGRTNLSCNIDNDVAVDNWKVVFDSIRNAEKANETIEDVNEFPTFRLGDFSDKAIEQRNKDNLPTSPVGDPEEVRQSAEEDEQRKENMICDDHNESNSPISTAILRSPRTSSLSLQQQEVNTSEHDNTLASLIGSENRGSELEIQEEVEADRELRTQDALHILSKKGKGMEYWLFSTWHKDSIDTQRKILRSDAYIREQQEVYGYSTLADDWMTANKHRLPELQNKFKEWFSCRSKK
ncbi:hypothetical protein SASPL_143811 [Salvia splendens]|uniref:Uncharacterized protein n=1 Tax=Salvia splendens TaxID=180675 RepID=A0A8X8WMV8_SALSN|nr:hypothetical protein SASPL_143811 [Salvia splendens]